ncbi:hypothetical protein [Mesorhizobium xinjiangense]|uniref:hypothetical protein n=1 Tax=Mesorhizobium xinjiangense TaxID=2678685 RepID=UPI0012ED0814|nr:hypothetical protein [Mesorhizobium xinjiangense]
MEHIAALLFIVGCSADLEDCRELPAPVPLFETAQACKVEHARAERRFDGLYPRVFMTCFEVDPALEYENAELVWDVEPDGRLVVEIVPTDIMVAEEAKNADRPPKR